MQAAPYFPTDAQTPSPYKQPAVALDLQGSCEKATPDDKMARRRLRQLTM